MTRVLQRCGTLEGGGTEILRAENTGVRARSCPTDLNLNWSLLFLGAVVHSQLFRLLPSPNASVSAPRARPNLHLPLHRSQQAQP